MMTYEYDEESSLLANMDVAKEIDERPVPVTQWADAMRRLNAITDPLSRRLLALHQACGSGTGECDSGEDETPIRRRHDWGCETTAIIASHHRISFMET